MPVGLAPQYAQTYVIKLGSLCDSLSAWMTGRLAEGAGGCASVTLPATEETYIVLTEAVAHRFEWRVRHLKGSVQQLPGNPRVQWIRPLTRPLQRLLGWGDVLSTKDDVACACEAGDKAELKALMPQAVALVDREEFDQLPMLYEAFRDVTLVLEDCSHDFKDACGLQADKGCCERGARDAVKGLHCPPYRQCRHCGLQLCPACCRGVAWEQEAKGYLREAWQRCQEIRQDPFAPQCVWQQHPTRPLPFYVIDQQKMPEADKLAWMRQALQEGASLPEFAMKFVELFGEKLRGQVPQKTPTPRRVAPGERRATLRRSGWSPSSASGTLRPQTGAPSVPRRSSGQAGSAAASVSTRAPRTRAAAAARSSTGCTPTAAPASAARRPCAPRTTRGRGTRRPRWRWFSGSCSAAMFPRTPPTSPLGNTAAGAEGAFGRPFFLSPPGA